MKEEANQRLGTDPVEKSWELFYFIVSKNGKKSSD